jgi:hypothetical protein
MIERVILICLVASVGVLGCGGSDGGGPGGEAGEGGADGAAGIGGRDGGTGGGGGGGGDGGMGGEGGEGGAGGEVGPVFTSVMDRIDAGLVYRLEGCQCQDPGEAISESACLALINFTGLTLSDRQSACIDEVILAEEERTLENRFACLIEVDLAAASCLAEVSECSESAIADCVDARSISAGSCSTPQASVLESFFGCQATVVEDAVDAFLDSRSAQCDCVTGCTSADPEPDVVECMLGTLQAEVDVLPQGPTELKCINEFWRRKAVCFGNEMTCDGPVTACSDLPPMLCGISGTILDDCLTL